MIEAHELTKRYGDTIAVHSLSFTIAPGTVTGFPGPNHAGKSTTMRMIMGLDRPTPGTVTVNGKPYRQHRAPLREAGALLEASAVHPGRSARSHLREGVQWVGQLVRALAAEGRTVFLALLAPDERDVPDRRPSPGDRPRSRHRRRPVQQVIELRRRRRCAGALPARR